MKKIEKYLEQTNKHLFKTSNGSFFKVMPFEKDGVKYFVALTFKEDLSVLSIQVRKVSTYDVTSSAGKEYIPSYLKNYNLFPSENKRTSIKNFKAMKEKMKTIKQLLESEYDENEGKKGFFSRLNVGEKLKANITKVLR